GSGQRLDQGDCALPRSVDRRFVWRTQRFYARTPRLEQIGGLESGAVAQVVARRIGFGARNQRATALEPNDARAAAGDGEREITDSAEKVRDVLARMRVQQGDGTPH